MAPFNRFNRRITCTENAYNKYVNAHTAMHYAAPLLREQHKTETIKIKLNSHTLATLAHQTPASNINQTANGHERMENFESAMSGLKAQK